MDQAITYKGKVVFMKLSMPSFSRTLKSYVEDEACFMFLNKGEVNVRTQDDYLKLNQNVGMLAKCLNYFFEPSQNKDACNDGIEAIGIFLYPSLVKELFEFDLSTSQHQVNYNVKQVQIDKMLNVYKESINILLENPELADESIVETKLKEFVLLASKSEGAPSQLDFLSALFKPNEVEFKTTIQQNLFANLSLDELALLCHLSLSSFKRKFIEVYGESPKKYINRKKIEKAAQLLQSPESRISDVAFDVGFDSLATFNRNFTQVFGQSPSKYRLS
ncbi:helix-turn-helix domain-containing protein [Flammeovirga yaeyamensis]|uniref:Helix-turn-helix domain-containing protein n=1 Tax=Flammeovirga yaeyamensis TaxID=367791 RepID=A0AAX1NF49_9BACT|nr:AraC family transcriptional regulator [Flammeovirga yaeyamensis]MBB3699959.1 AraC-like DNA-binding protein [Flammeovirga yaeyamensis]NMF37602.1 helix-turn-helix transcriptional regulator [Flammeovirga yaeyamensis]QWG04658.1 helix-turn-helix domain-containing protein [Flammeovirga yaeyamensis]